MQKDTVDSAWNENRPKHNQQKAARIQKPSSSTLSHTAIISSEPKSNTMMGGWDDTPAANAVSSLDAGWNDNQLNLEQPCTEEGQLPSTDTVYIHLLVIRTLSTSFMNKVKSKLMSQHFWSFF